MRGQILRLTIALVLGIGLVGPALHFARAQDSGSIAIGDTVSVDTDGVNIRKTASTSGEIITTVNAGTTLEILDGPTDAGGYTWWMGVVLNADSVDQGITGWVVEDFLTVEDVSATPTPGTGTTPTPGNTPTPKPGVTPTATPTPGGGEVTFDTATWVIVVDGPVNLRKNPGLSGAVVRALGTDESASVVNPSELTDRDGYSWINVKTRENETGWLATDFLDPLADDPCANNACQPVEHQDLLDADAVVVVDGPLNVRSSAAADGTILDTVATGAVLNTAAKGEIKTAGGYDWLKVDYNGQDGWVAVDFVSVSTDTCDVSPCFPEPSTGDDPFAGALGVRVVDGPLNVRDIAGLGGTAFAVLDTGAEVPVDTRAVVTDADQYTWIRVVTSAGTGWVATDFVEPLNYAPDVDGADGGFATAEGVEVVDGPVNVRSDPSLSGEINSVQDTGLQFSRVAGSDLVQADGYTWINIMNLGGVRGWMATDFLSPIADMPCTDGACYPTELDPFFGATGAFVTDGPLNLRSEPGTNSPIAMTLEDGDFLTIESVIDSNPYEADGYLWIQVTPAGTNLTGFVAIDFVTPAE
jgi:uncharacterized protein YgiM (DUF1202 family)